ncbi:hypothetical protein PILCRDRAFT_378143 [Piloderma croceum F 1598]|uniref:Uncharacterized protein n=1 Tax=Piloderma croceum (strain F 1598) TaxID=765440 RepID=A0A0C3FLP4_PILCF|nr:hypothetical protein PILCRDRAFT_378143 [Piloderma croceum F 1598]
MTDRSNPLERDGENLLQSALATAFGPVPSVRRSQPAQPSPAPAPPPPAAGDSTSADVDLSSSVSTDDSWKSEYDSQVQSWRAQSAEAREKSERERARWEEIRARERQEGGSRHRQVEEAPEPSPADVRDLVSGEHEGTGEESKASSQKWSDVPSDLASSYPSISFPSPSRPTSPSHSHPRRTHPQPTSHAYHADPQSTHSPDAGPVPTSATLAIFDSSLSIQTRLGALISSLGINLVLPFVNGVMLGFGEIFAKNIVAGWLGWKSPGSGIANVGIRSTAVPGRR